MDKRQKIIQILEPSIDGFKNFRGLEIENIGKDGRALILETTGVPYFDGRGNHIGFRGTSKDITERKRSEEVLRRRDDILEAVNLISERLIKGALWEENIYDVLDIIGDSVNADRVRIYQFMSEQGCDRKATCRFEWTPQGTTEVTHNLNEIDLRNMGLERWMDTLTIGGMVKSGNERRQGPEHDLMLQEGARSMLMIPILAGYTLWGFMRLDDVEEERTWPPSELDALRTAASTLGAAVQREQGSRELETEKERLTVTLRSIADGVITTDTSCAVVIMNKSAERMIGVSQEDVFRKDPQLGLQDPERWTWFFGPQSRHQGPSDRRDGQP